MGVTNSQFTSQNGTIKPTYPLRRQGNHAQNDGQRLGTTTRIHSRNGTNTPKNMDEFSTIELNVTDISPQKVTVQHEGIHHWDTEETSDESRPNGDIRSKLHPNKILQSSLAKDIYIKQTADTHDCWITDLSVLNNGTLALVDNNNDCIKVIDAVSNVLRAYIPIGLTDKPWALCQNANDNIVITCGHDIVTIDSDTYNVINRLTVCDWTRGIVCDSDVLIYVCTSPRPAVKVITMDGVTVNSLELNADGQTMFVCPWYITLSRDRNHLYVTDCGNNSVICISRRDDTQRVYNPCNLSSPQGLAIGTRGNIFICSLNNVHNVLLDLGNGHVMLTIVKCHGVCFDQSNDQLYLSYHVSSKKHNYISTLRIE